MDLLQGLESPRFLTMGHTHTQTQTERDREREVERDGERQRETEDRDRDREAGGQIERTETDRQTKKENRVSQSSKILDHCICEFQNHFYT